MINSFILYRVLRIHSRVLDRLIILHIICFVIHLLYTVNTECLLLYITSSSAHPKAHP